MATTRFSDFTEKTDPTDAQWVGLDGVGANARFPASTFVEPLRDNITYTVGAGQDFETLDAAILYINTRPTGAGNAASLYGDTRIPRYTLALADGVHTPGAPNGRWRLEGVTAQVAIRGNGSGVCTVGDASSYLILTSCSMVRIDGLTLEGRVHCVNSLLLIKDDTYDLVAPTATLSVQRGGELSIGDVFTCRSIYTFGDSLVSSTYALTLDGTNNAGSPMLDVNSNSSVSVDSLILIGDAAATANALNAATNGTVTVSGGISISGGSVSQPAIGCSEYSSISAGTGIVNTGLYPTIASFPVGELQYDGSVIYDGVTPPTNKA